MISFDVARMKWKPMLSPQNAEWENDLRRTILQTFDLLLMSRYNMTR